MKGYKESAPEANHHQISTGVWLLTFSDLLTLLLTLFVMRYAMSAVSKTTWERVSASVRTAMHATNKAEPSEPMIFSASRSLRALSNEEASGVVMSVDANPSLLMVELSGSIFFGDTDELTFSGKERLQRIAAVLRDQPANVEITAHARIRSPQDASFASPWELSAAWAAAVSRQMIDAGVPRSVISAAGVADINEDEARKLGKDPRRIAIAITPRG